MIQKKELTFQMLCIYENYQFTITQGYLTNLFPEEGDIQSGMIEEHYFRKIASTDLNFGPFTKINTKTTYLLHPKAQKIYFSTLTLEAIS